MGWGLLYMYMYMLSWQRINPNNHEKHINYKSKKLQNMKRTFNLRLFVLRAIIAL